MKKFFAALTAAAMLIAALSGCSGQQPSQSESPASGSESSSQQAESVEPRYLTLSAVASSSGLFPYCVAIGDVLSNIPELEITVAESGGNVANTQELRVGDPNS